MAAERSPFRRSARQAAGRLGASLLLLLPLAVAAQQAPAAAAACAACHGADGNSPVPDFPSLAGQPRVFTENQLVLIREGLRDVPAMTEVMKGVDDATIVELSRYYAARQPMPPDGPVRKASYDRGARLSQQHLCGTCHLPGYVGQNQVPRLAWQQEAYLVSSMKQFRDNPGPGRDTIMAATLRGLSDADLADLAHYFAQSRR